MYLAAIAAAIVALAALWPGSDPDSSVEAVTDGYEAPMPLAQPASSTSVAKPGSRRSIFRHSVIPGGVYSDGELRAAMRNDPVVAAHYKTVGRSPLRAEVVSHDRMVYVSYRRGDDIYWTGKKVLLRAGETILTDGSTQIRARCGNCISEAPVAPVADVEPDVVEFEALAPDDSVADEADSPAGAWGAGGAGAPALVAAGPAGQRAPSAAVPFVFPAAGPAPFVQWGGGLPATRELKNDAPAVESEPAGDGHEPSPPVDQPPPGDGSPPSDNPQPPGNPPVDTPPDNPPVGTTPDNPPGDTTPPGDTPLEPDLNPVPVPEPSTLLLVGGGVAALLRRMRSRDSRRPATRIDS